VWPKIELPANHPTQYLTTWAINKKKPKSRSYTLYWRPSFRWLSRFNSKMLARAQLRPLYLHASTKSAPTNPFCDYRTRLFRDSTKRM